MSQLRLSKMTQDLEIDKISCGVPSIDEMIKNAYYEQLCKQGVAYNIFVDHKIIGNCMIKFVCLQDEMNDYVCGSPEFVACEIAYIAIDKRVQHQKFGSVVLNILINHIGNLAKELPIRFLVIDALKDKEQWYVHNGFQVYPKKADLRHPDTIPMLIDFIDKNAVERYIDGLA